MRAGTDGRRTLTRWMADGLPHARGDGRFVIFSHGKALAVAPCARGRTGVSNAVLLENIGCPMRAGTDGDDAVDNVEHLY